MDVRALMKFSRQRKCLDISTDRKHELLGVFFYLQNHFNKDQCKAAVKCLWWGWKKKEEI